LTSSGLAGPLDRPSLPICSPFLRAWGLSSSIPFLAAFTPDGHLKWKIEIHGMVREAPAIASDGTIFFTTDQGYAYAVSDTGSPPLDSSWPRFQHDAQNSGHPRFQFWRSASGKVKEVRKS
jgi:PQQ-like domain